MIVDFIGGLLQQLRARKPCSALRGVYLHNLRKDVHSCSTLQIYGLILLGRFGGLRYVCEDWIISFDAPSATLTGGHVDSQSLAAEFGVPKR